MAPLVIAEPILDSPDDRLTLIFMEQGDLTRGDPQSVQRVGLLLRRLRLRLHLASCLRLRFLQQSRYELRGVHLGHY